MDCPSAVKKSTTSSRPLVMVPVLSLKRIFREPAVSIPSAFLTSTLWSSILLVFCISTSEIISGRPSGTAQTMITTARDTALTRSWMITSKPCPKYAPGPPPRRIKLTKYSTAITTAPIYPKVEICFASFASLTFSGESGSSSCISSAILPIMVFRPTLRTSRIPSPSNTTAPRKRECLSTNVSPVMSSASWNPSSAAVFLHSSASPLRAELSTRREPSTRIPSAGTLSPDWRRTLSPTTTSSTSMMVITPFLWTLHLSFSVLSFSSRYFVSLATPVLADTKATMITATMVPKGS